MSEILERLKWVPQAPDPDSALKQEYKNTVANYMVERFRDGYREAPPPSYEMWSKGKTSAEKAAKQKEYDEAVVEAKTHREKEQATAAELAKAQAKLEKLEAAAKVKRIDEYMTAKGWDPRGRKRGKAIGQMSKMGLLDPPKGAA